MTEFVQSLIEGIPMPALLIGADMRIGAANSKAADLFGATIIGRHYVIGLRQPALLDAISQTFEDRVSRSARLVLPSAQQELTFDVHLAPIAENGVMCCFHDSTEMERVTNMRRDFVANVSHELRTPLTALIGFIETLKGPAKDDASARLRFLTIMEREAGRMNRLVRDLLHLSRVEAEERIRPRERVDVSNIVAMAVASLRPLAVSSDVTIDVIGANATELPGDADQLTQVFNNLIENAIKYGGHGKTVQILFTTEDSLRGRVLRVDVVDQGEGIDPIHLPRLTERFYRVDSHRSREQGGTGLGLAIVKHIVSRHRGWFKVDSILGQGSTFSVLLPLA